jgi:hypothetical protein
MSVVTNLLRVGLSNSDGSAVNFSTLVPNAQQISLGPSAEYYDVNAAPKILWMLNKLGTAFEQITGGASGGSSTLAGLSDITTYDIASNNPSVTAVKTIANAAIPAVQKATASGVATLDSASHLPAAQLTALTGDVTSTAGSSATTVTPTAPALNTQPLNTQAGTAYTLVATDAGQNIDMTNASANVVTIPANVLPLYAVVSVTQAGTGTTSIAAGSGVTVNIPPSGSLAISEQNRSAVLYQTANNVWRVVAG